jgi:hypothetical protein
LAPEHQLRRELVLVEVEVDGGEVMGCEDWEVFVVLEIAPKHIIITISF